MPGASEVLSGGDHMHNRSADYPRVYRVARNKLTWGTRWIESASERPYLFIPSRRNAILSSSFSPA